MKPSPPPPPPPPSAPAAAPCPPAPRLRSPDRSLILRRELRLDGLLPEDHLARLVWDYVVHQDLSRLLNAIKARGSNSGRPAIDPHLLLALWLYATLDGVSRGRDLHRLTFEHDAYRWICGGVSVNYHVINDMRSGNAKLMDELLSNNLAALAACGAISLDMVAQDGMRVRASAGAASFRRKASLEEHLQQAQALVQDLKTQAQAGPGPVQRALSARQRAAHQRAERVQQALQQLPELTAIKQRKSSKSGKSDKPVEARVSTTDPDARVMKMADGGFRPAYNVQFASTCAQWVIVGMDVVNVGSDMAQIEPMVDQVQRHLGCTPKKFLVDGGFPAHEQINAVAHRTELYAPVPEPKTPKTDPAQPQHASPTAQDPSPPESPPVLPPRPDKYQPKPDDSKAVADWRKRMATDEAKEIYKQRAATAECVNAQVRNRGLQQMPVRGLERVRSVVGLHVLAHNLLRINALAPHLIGRARPAPS